MKEYLLQEAERKCGSGGYGGQTGGNSQISSFLMNIRIRSIASVRSYLTKLQSHSQMRTDVEKIVYEGKNVFGIYTV